MPTEQSLREQIAERVAALAALEPDIKENIRKLLYSSTVADFVELFEAPRRNTSPGSVLDNQLGLVKQAVDNMKLYLPENGQ